MYVQRNHSMSQEKVTENFVDHDEKIRNYTLNTIFVLITCDIGEEDQFWKRYQLSSQPGRFDKRWENMIS
jgi:hypothetical protein